MSNSSTNLRALSLGLVCLLVSGPLLPRALAQEVPTQAIADLDKALAATKEGSSEARQRLAVRRVIRDAERLSEAHKNDARRFYYLEFLFRARQQLIALDKDPKHRRDLLETCRELVKAPDGLADLRFEADLLLSQAELAVQGANAEARAAALRPFVGRYLETPVGARVLRMALVMALEFGDDRLVNEFQQMVSLHFSSDVEMIRFQRDRLGGDVFGAPLCGTFQMSDGKTARLPMDMLGRSTMLIFWSKEGEGMEFIKGLAADALAIKDVLAKRLEIISFNLDDLPDAGESIVRGLGVDWQVLRLPGGRKHPVYNAYVRTDPLMVNVSPTGQSALIMQGTGRVRTTKDGTLDHERMLRSELSKSWGHSRYAMQLSALFAGDFLVLDPEGGVDPTRPPELKAAAKSDKVKPMPRNNASVPEETLSAIQDSFVAPPLRYRLSHAEVRASYTKVVSLCRKAIADHSQAPDLWIVRNRLIIALMGLWKTDAELRYLEESIIEAKAAIAAGYPEGCDTIARFCLAREALRDPAADPRMVLDRFVADNGGDEAQGTVFAVTALLSLDAADRKRFEDCRGIILADHAEEPMMWPFTAFLLDRYHEYFLFQVPFSVGRSYMYRDNYFLTRGVPEASRRTLKGTFKTLDGRTIRLPDALSAKWSAMVLATPWGKGEGPSPERDVKNLMSLAERRPQGEMEVILAVLSEDAEKVRALLNEKPLEVKVLLVPGGMDSPLVQRLGVISEDEQANRVLLRKDGTIATMVSGLSARTKAGDPSFQGIMTRQDERDVRDAIARGDLEEAKRIAFTFAPVFDPEATDEKGRKLKRPSYSPEHLRARARVYVALEQWDKALIDAEEVVQRQLGISGGMSLRTEELDESEEFRDTILEKMGAKGGAG